MDTKRTEPTPTVEQPTDALVKLLNQDDADAAKVIATALKDYSRAQLEEALIKTQSIHLTIHYLQTQKKLNWEFIIRIYQTGNKEFFKHVLSFITYHPLVTNDPDNTVNNVLALAAALFKKDDLSSYQFFLLFYKEILEEHAITLLCDAITAGATSCIKYFFDHIPREKLRDHWEIILWTAIEANRKDILPDIRSLLETGTLIENDVDMLLAAVSPQRPTFNASGDAKYEPKDAAFFEFVKLRVSPATIRTHFVALICAAIKANNLPVFNYFMGLSYAKEMINIHVEIGLAAIHSQRPEILTSVQSRLNPELLKNYYANNRQNNEENVAPLAGKFAHAIETRNNTLIEWLQNILNPAIVDSHFEAILLAALNAKNRDILTYIGNNISQVIQNQESDKKYQQVNFGRLPTLEMRHYGPTSSALYHAPAGSTATQGGTGDRGDYKQPQPQQVSSLGLSSSTTGSLFDRKYN